MAGKAALIALAICILFAVAGAKFLDVMGITLSSFRIAGGTLLFLIRSRWCLRILRALDRRCQSAKKSLKREDISVFPLAFPFIAGPGALATILLMSGETWGRPALFAGFLAVVVAVHAVCWGLMLAAPRLMRVLGVTGANVMSRLSGVVLAALAVQFIIDGIRGSFFGGS